MTKALTAKQEAFAIAVAKGANASDAYRQAYDASGSKDEAIWVNASKTLKNAKVALRISELRSVALQATDVDLERWMRETSKYAFTEVGEDLKHADKRGYLDMIGRSVGAYEKDNLQRADNLVLKVEAARKR